MLVSRWSHIRHQLPKGLSSSLSPWASTLWLPLQHKASECGDKRREHSDIATFTGFCPECTWVTFVHISGQSKSNNNTICIYIYILYIIYIIIYNIIYIYIHILWVGSVQVWNYLSARGAQHNWENPGAGRWHYTFWKNLLQYNSWQRLKWNWEEGKCNS